MSARLEALPPLILLVLVSVLLSACSTSKSADFLTVKEPSELSEPSTESSTDMQAPITFAFRKLTKKPPVYVEQSGDLFMSVIRDCDVSEQSLSRKANGIRQLFVGMEDVSITESSMLAEEETSPVRVSNAQAKLDSDPVYLSAYSWYSMECQVDVVVWAFAEAFSEPNRTAFESQINGFDKFFSARLRPQLEASWE